jgi:anti-sigma factor RsiW
VDLVDRGERGPATAAALDHLAICDRCEREITELALTIAALRRAGAAYRALAVPAAPRAAVVARAPASRPRPWSWRMQLGGLMTSAAIAGLLVAPRVGLVPRPDAGPIPQHPAGIVSWQAVEHRLAVTPDVAPVAVVRSLPPRYPEGMIRPWKEVPASDAAARELEPS